MVDDHFANIHRLVTGEPPPINETLKLFQDIYTQLVAVDAAKKISADSGKQFDPKVVAAFMKVVKQFDDIRANHKDELEGIHDLDFGSPKKK